MHLYVALLDSLGTAFKRCPASTSLQWKTEPLLTSILLKTSLRKHSVFIAVERVNTIS